MIITLYVVYLNLNVIINLPLGMASDHTAHKFQARAALPEWKSDVAE